MKWKPGITEPSRLGTAKPHSEYHGCGELEWVKIDNRWYCVNEIVETCDCVKDGDIEFIDPAAVAIWEREREQQ